METESFVRTRVARNTFKTSLEEWKQPNRETSSFCLSAFKTSLEEWKHKK